MGERTGFAQTEVLVINESKVVGCYGSRCALMMIKRKGLEQCANPRNLLAIFSFSRFSFYF